ncbi:MAG: zinc ribbon domain-containing protein [Hyphomicrobiales bacterium]|nr:zinc ribbon domain-containing protein [Hyphomicrobiales bacterium]
MPVYEYECSECGVFTVLRPMHECRDPLDCPECGEAAERVLLSMPAIAGMDPAQRKALSVNEKASHEPRSSRQGHGAGCSCCSGANKSGGRTATAPNGAKSFPKSRPWMISH